MYKLLNLTIVKNSISNAEQDFQKACMPLPYFSISDQFPGHQLKYFGGPDLQLMGDR